MNNKKIRPNYDEPIETTIEDVETNISKDDLIGKIKNMPKSKRIALLSGLAVALTPAVVSIIADGFKDEELGEETAIVETTESTKEDNENESEGYEISMPDSYVLSSYNVNYNLNLRNATLISDTNILYTIPEGSTIYTSPKYFFDCGSIKWAWSKVYNAETKEYMDGFVAVSDDSYEYLSVEIENPTYYCVEDDKEMEVIEKKVDVENELNIRSTPSIDNNKIGSVNANDIVYTVPELSEVEWEQIIYMNNNIPTKAWVSKEFLKDVSEIDNRDTGVIYGYIEREITENDISNLRNFINSWENSELYHYMTGMTDSYSDLDKYMTEDGKGYKCYIDYSSTTNFNYGFGVQIKRVYDDGMEVVNTDHIKAFEDCGIDIRNPIFSNGGENPTVIEKETIEYVQDMYIKNSIKVIKDCLKDRNIDFSKTEILALAAMSYQMGDEPEQIHDFLNYYEQSNGNTEKLKEIYRSYEGDKAIFQHGNVGGSWVGYDGRKFDRADSFWSAFHDGIFVAAAGPEQIITFDKEKNMDFMCECVEDLYLAQSRATEEDRDMEH